MQKITLIGRLGRDAAIRETENGTKIISFTMAVNGRFRGTEKTSWYDVSSFNYDRYHKMAKYLTKGSSVVVTGDLDADIEEGSDGKFRCRRYVMADAIEFNSNGSSSGGTREERTESERPSRSRRDEDIPDDIPDEEVTVSPRKRKAEPEPEEYNDDEPEVKPSKRKSAPVEDDEEEEPKPRKRKPVPVEADGDEDEELPF